MLIAASTSSSGVEVATVAIAAMVAVVGFRAAGQRTVQKDPQRAFTVAQRTAGFARCGNRCEHISIFGRRCTAAPTHGDHIWPHSKGGATTLANFAGLCARHNLMKGARTPSRWAIRRLERRRRSYFPPGHPVEVVWQVGRRGP